MDETQKATSIDPGGAPDGPLAMIGAETLATARRRTWFSFALTLLFAGLTLWGTAAWLNGLPFGGEIRPDPFDKRPGLADLLLHPLPHRALQTMPYVPIGARGTLTLRPARTDWINTPAFPGAGSGEGAATGGRAGLLSPISSALAQASKKGEPVPQAEAETRPPAQEIQQVEPAPEEPPSVLQAQPTPAQGVASSEEKGGAQGTRIVLPTRPLGSGTARGVEPYVLDASCIDAQTCWLVGDAGTVALTRDGGATWSGESLVGDAPTGDVRLISALPPLATGPYNAVDVDGLLLAIEPLGDDSLIVTSPVPDQAVWHQLVLTTPTRTTSGNDVVWVRKPQGLLVRATEQPPPTSAVARFVDPTGQILAIAPEGQVAEPQLVMSEVPVDGSLTLVQVSFGGHSVNAVLAGPAPGVYWVLGDAGLLARVDSALLNASTALRTPPTRANLRYIRFAAADPGGTPQIGWISSGWDDGNKEGERPVILQTLDGGETWQRLSYRHWPAPWIFLTGFLAAVAAARGAGQYRRVRALEAVFAQQERIIGADAASDSPIGWGDEDVLGLRPIARALSRFIRNRDTLPPVTFGITGAWGTGKSSLMRLVAEDLRFYGARPVQFNAWHHQTEDHLLAALLDAIKSQGVPGWWTFSGLLLRANLLLRRSLGDLKTLFAAAFIAALAIGLTGLLRDDDLVQDIGALLLQVRGVLDAGTPAESVARWLFGGLGASGATLALLFALTRSLRQLKVITVKPAALMARLSSRAGINQFEAQLGFRHRFQAEFGQVCQAMRTTGVPGMVIFIDDLDRCKPDKVLVVLEAVNFLVSAGPCFVLLGIDEEKVIQSVAHGFKDSILVPPDEADRREDGELRPSGRQVFQFARNYLEKLINISVPVPETDETKTGALLGAEHLPSLEREAATDRRPFSDLPRRLRMGLRTTLDTAAGLVPMAVLLVLLAQAVADLMPEREPAATTAAETERVVADDAADSGTATSGEAAGFAQIDLDAEANAAVDPASLGALSWWWIVVVAAAVALLILVVALRRTSGIDKAEEQDRPEFRAALALWLPLIHARHPTPRSIKRFQNHTRFLAMLLRGQSREHDWLDRLAERLGYRTRHAEPPPPALEEQKLVALQSLYDFDPALLAGELTGNVVDLFSPGFGTTSAKVSEGQRRSLNEIVSRLEGTDVEAFLALRPTVTSAHGRFDEPGDMPGDAPRKSGPSEAAE